MSTTLIKSTVNGLILDIPIKVGESVIMSNSFNDGTTIATVANMNDLIFKGSIDETEVDRVHKGMPMQITIGALQGKKFDAILEYIAPKVNSTASAANQFEIKAAVKIPIELHTHCTSGFGHATYLKAIEAGVDIIDTALAPFSSDTSQPCTETMVAMLEGEERDTGLDRQAMTPISKYFLKVKQDLIKTFNLKGYFDVNPNVLDFQIPGGMLSNLANQLKEAGMEDKYQDLLDEMPRVRKDVGYPPLVTPSSQIVGTMATFNVMSGQRYKMVPNEFKDLARGKFGRTPVEVDRKFLTDTLGIAPEDIIEDCSIEDAKAKTFDEFKEELKGKGYLNPTDEDVLSYALFPQVAEEFFKAHYKPITAYVKE